MDHPPEPGEMSACIRFAKSWGDKNLIGKRTNSYNFSGDSLKIIFNLKAFLLPQLFNSKKKRTAQKRYSLTAVSGPKQTPYPKPKSSQLHFVTAELCNQY